MNAITVVQLREALGSAEPPLVIMCGTAAIRR